MTKHDLEIVSLLANLGVETRQAKILTFLASAQEAKSAQLERACRLRQPEVSVATKVLRTRGWIGAEERRGVGKGRPVHFYRLGRKLGDVVEEIAQEKRLEAEMELAKVERLRDLVTRARDARPGPALEAPPTP